MLLPIIIILSIIILVTIICAAGHKISKKEIRYPATWDEGLYEDFLPIPDDEVETDPMIMACLEELGYGRG